MPPKKAEAPEQRPILGRFSSNLKIGIVGLPNVGKSTLFNAMTKLRIPAESAFPFCTIDPNAARINVPDERFTWLCEHWKPKSEVPAFLEVVDIAGLVKGAAQGQGLGNAFLSHIRGVDGIFHVLRAFEDTEVTHVEGGIDPIRDCEIISGELIAKDVEMLTKTKEGLESALKKQPNNKAQKAELDIVSKMLEQLNAGKWISACDWKMAELDTVNAQFCLTAKPVVYLINVSEDNYIQKKNKWLVKIKEYVDSHGGGLMIPFSGALEGKLQDMEEEDAKKYLEEKKAQSSLGKIAKQGYSAIQLIHFFTCGTDEVKCWTIRKGTKAPQAAGVIHTDFEKGFICAEVMKYDEFKEAGNEAAVKAAGKYRQQGKEYVVEDGDIIFFKFNVAGGGKK
eukprot:tig00021348_g20599.t1